jgi:hypothetical protein
VYYRADTPAGQGGFDGFHQFCYPERIMEPTPELIDEMERERIRAARAMSGDEKVLLGLQLFECTCRIMADGIRDEFPDADEDRVQEILRERLAIARRLEDSV